MMEMDLKQVKNIVNAEVLHRQQQVEFLVDVLGGVSYHEYICIVL